jgi:hypothetical protein
LSVLLHGFSNNRNAQSTTLSLLLCNFKLLSFFYGQRLVSPYRIVR